MPQRDRESHRKDQEDLRPEGDQERVRIDYYEYPGKSAYPKTNVSGLKRAKCGAKGKRLCSNKEWRQACGVGTLMETIGKTVPATPCLRVEKRAKSKPREKCKAPMD